MALALTDVSANAVSFVLVVLDVTGALSEVDSLGVFNLSLKFLALELELGELSGKTLEVSLLLLIENTSSLGSHERKSLLDLVNVDLILNGLELDIEVFDLIGLNFVVLLNDDFTSYFDNLLNIDVLVNLVKLWDFDSPVDSDSLGNNLLSWVLDNSLDEVLLWSGGLDWSWDLFDLVDTDVDVDVLGLLLDSVLWVVGIYGAYLLEIVLLVLDWWGIVYWLVSEHWLADLNWLEIGLDDLNWLGLLFVDSNLDINVLLEIDDDLLVLSDLEKLINPGVLDVLD